MSGHLWVQFELLSGTDAFILMDGGEFLLKLHSLNHHDPVAEGLPAIVNKLSSYGIGEQACDMLFCSVELTWRISLRCPRCNELNYTGQTCMENMGVDCLDTRTHRRVKLF